MLHHIRSFQYLHIIEKAHLGDIIAGVQWAHHFQKKSNSQCFIYGGWTCPCHGMNASNQIEEVLALLDTDLKHAPYENYHHKKEVPICFNSGFQIIYAKAKDLPSQRSDHITVQFHARGRHGNALNNSTINWTVNALQGREIFNLGDKHIPGTTHFHGNVKEKFDLIASARYHVGLDSGMAHLASMTNTITLVITPQDFFNRYSSQNNVTLCDEYDSREYIKKLLSGAFNFYDGFKISLI